MANHECDLCDCAKSRPSRSEAIFEIGLTDGEDVARKLDYITLPASVRKDILKEWPR